MPKSTATQVLDREFLSIRCRLLDLAAAMDRVDRAEGRVTDDRRWQQIHKALDTIAAPNGNRAEQTQLAFSLPYSENWRHEYEV
jgi:hypothetical protein